MFTQQRRAHWGTLYMESFHLQSKKMKLSKGDEKGEVERDV